jgi:menaquinol-cytochrome c reductase cytochrome b/c subunit
MSESLTGPPVEIKQGPAKTRPLKPRPERVLAWPHLVIRHAVIAVLTLLVVSLLAIAFNAPLQDMADPNLTPAVAKAPWYFAGLQELLSYMHPMVAGVIAPLAVVLFLTFLPYLDKSQGWRLRDRKMIAIVFFTVMTAAFVLTVIGSFFRGPEWHWVWPWDHLYLEL